jgi:diguanylate cyclase (GGDEF)-like protein/PAS domain S-box-containing protein
MALAEERVARAKAEENLVDARQRMDLAVEGANIGVWHWNVETRDLYRSPSLSQIYRLPHDAEPDLDLFLAGRVHPDDQETLHVGGGTLRHQGWSDLELRVRRGDDRYIWIRARTSALFDDKGEPTRMGGTVEDITTRVHAMEQLRASEARLASLIETAPFPIIIANWNDTRLMQVNTAADGMFAVTAQEGDMFDLATLFADPADYDAFRKDLGETGMVRVMEAELVGANGTRFWGLVSAILVDIGLEQCVDVMINDITVRKEMEQRLLHLATTDMLTGLVNRRGFQDVLDRAIEDAGSEAESFTLMMLDLDKFKIVNDTFGHAAGDALLKDATARLKACLAPDDVAARLGGDEFAVLLPGRRPVEFTAALARRIVEALSLPFVIEDTSVTIGTSIGVAVYPGVDNVEDSLMRHADFALYRAKFDGRGCHRFFDEELAAVMLDRAKLEHDLHFAIERNQFSLVFQPRVDALSWKPQAAEALLRWQHPTRGAVSPVEFIPLAEECGLIVDIGKWVMTETCTQIAAWRSRGLTIPISINMSAVQINTGDIAQVTADSIARAGIPAEALQIEITETMLINAQGENIDKLRELRKMGVKILLDDFGTGYSSLAYLRNFPVDKLKIDKSFVHRLTDPTDAALTQSIVSIGKNLRLAIVAEGVETESQAEFLRALGCDEMQGFLFSRPLSASDFEIWMGTSPERLIA